MHRHYLRDSSTSDSAPARNTSARDRAAPASTPALPLLAANHISPHVESKDSAEAGSGYSCHPTEKAVLPSTITRDGYVYVDFANRYFGIAHASQEGTQISYNYPIEFLSEHKNLIYDNGGSRIFI